jgi:2-iminobutanoate/2-iminopropanoate deaminase
VSSPVGPYSPSRRVDRWLVTSGQIGITGTPAALVPGGFEPELRQALANLASVLEAGGASLNDVVKATVFLVDIGDYAAMNELWIEAFEAPRPARSAVSVRALPLGACVEVEAWARVSPGS